MILLPTSIKIIGAKLLYMLAKIWTTLSGSKSEIQRVQRDCINYELGIIEKELNLKKVDFINIDVHGYEYWVLKGGVNTISKFSPGILIELSPYVHVEHGSSFKDLVEFLYSLSYRFFSLSDRYELPFDYYRLVDMIPTSCGINALAKKFK